MLTLFAVTTTSNSSLTYFLDMKLDLPSTKKIGQALAPVRNFLRLNKKPIEITVAVLAVLITVLAIIFRPKPPQAPLATVEVEDVTVDDVNIYCEYVGHILPQHFVQIRARVEGYLQSINFVEGTYVNKGQTLFVIDPQLYEAHVNKARAQLNKARAVEHKAKRDLDRIKPLYEQNAASQLDLDNAIAAYETAQAEVVVSEADLTQAQLTLSYTRIASPISGYVSECLADIGNLVGPSSTSLLATVVKSDTVVIEFSMTALDYLRSKSRNVDLGNDESGLKHKSFISITLPDGTEYPLKGSVNSSEPQVDPKTGTFSVHADMPNPDRSLLPGEFTKVKVLLDVREKAIEVPSKALVIEKGGAFIYVVRPDSVVERRFIETGPEVGKNVIVERGLASGEKIVTEGYHKLTHGMKVNPIPAKMNDENEAIQTQKD